MTVVPAVRNEFTSFGRPEIGGRNHEGNVQSSVFSLAITSFSSSSSTSNQPIDWCSLPSLLIPRASSSSAVIQNGNMMVVAGGMGDAATILSSVEVFDVRHGTWTMAPSMNYGRYTAASCVAADGRFYVISGAISGKKQSSYMEAFDGSQWHVLPPCHHQREGAVAVAIDHCEPFHHTTTTLIANDNDFVDTKLVSSTTITRSRPQIYLIGGYANDEPLDTCERYDIELGEWFDMPPLCEPRFGARAVVWKENRNKPPPSTPSPPPNRKPWSTRSRDNLAASSSTYLTTDFSKRVEVSSVSSSKGGGSIKSVEAEGEWSPTIIVMGGYDSFASVEIYSFLTNRWTVYPHTIGIEHSFFACSLVDGVVIVMDDRGYAKCLDPTTLDETFIQQRKQQQQQQQQQHNQRAEGGEGQHNNEDTNKVHQLLPLLFPPLTACATAVL
jgi:hypothetical protein